MPATPIPISITATGGPSPNPVPCPNPDPPNSPPKLQWTNNNANSVTAFTLPTCVSPNTISLPLAAGASTIVYQVNSGSHGSYPYSYTIASADAGPQNGTIDVS